VFWEEVRDFNTGKLVYRSRLVTKLKFNTTFWKLTPTGYLPATQEEWDDPRTNLIAGDGDYFKDEKASPSTKP
jgi:hypothetical protein